MDVLSFDAEKMFEIRDLSNECGPYYYYFFYSG